MAGERRERRSSIQSYRLVVTVLLLSGAMRMNELDRSPEIVGAIVAAVAAYWLPQLPHPLRRQEDVTHG